MVKPRTLLAAAVSAVIVVVAFFFVYNSKTSAPKPRSDQPKAAAGFNKKQFSNDDPKSIWVIVNKKRPLNPKNYVPDDLRVPNVTSRPNSTNDETKMQGIAASALEEMFAGAKKDSINLLLASGYRSFSLQTSVYNRYVSTQGQATADSQSARPGYSEHQTGLAVDVGAANRTCEIQACFATTPEGQWVAANAYKYGFVIRYQNGTESTVGYIYEPWHIRYIGKTLSEEIHKQNNPTLEDFFGLPAAADY